MTLMTNDDRNSAGPGAEGSKPEKPATAPAEKKRTEGPGEKKPSYTYRGEGTGAFQVFAWNLGRLFSRVISVLWFRLHVSGQARIPEKGGVLLVANHQSFLDPWLLGIAPKRQIHYMARDTLFKGGFLHWLMELWNTFPVKRGSADFAAIRMGVEVLDKGYVLTIFPEGTRSEDGSIGPLAPGMSLILNRCKTEVSIVPAVIDGAFEAWPRDRKFPKLVGNRVRICHGKAIGPEEWKGLSAEELAMRVRGELVKLQKEMGSVHAGESERRLGEDLVKMEKEPKGKRRR